MIITFKVLGFHFRDQSGRNDLTDYVPHSNLVVFTLMSPLWGTGVSQTNDLTR